MAERKTVPARATPRLVRTLSFTVQRRATRSPIFWKHEGKATLGSPNIVSARLPISIKSIQHGSSGELYALDVQVFDTADLLRFSRKPLFAHGLHVAQPGHWPANR